MAIHAMTQAGTTTRPSAATPSPAIQRGGDDLAAGIERGEEDRAAATANSKARTDDIADHQPLRNLAAGPADMGDRLGAGQLHRDEIDHRRPRRPAGSTAERRHGRSRLIADQQRRRRCWRRRRRARAGRARSAGHRAAASCVAPSAACDSPSDSPPGKARRNHALITVRRFVHPLIHSSERASD